MGKKVVILGVNGGFGRLFSVLLFKEGLEITGVDINAEINPDSRCSKYIPSDLTIAGEEVNSLVQNADFIIICLPEDIAYKFFSRYEDQISKSALLIDTLSIKNKVASIYTSNDFNALSLNPMFGPDLEMEGKNMIVIKFIETPVAEYFISLLIAWKLNLVFLTAEEHDQTTSIIQAATHAAIISFGATLKESPIPLTALFKVATPPFLAMGALYSRMVSGSENVYWNIQNENIYASKARKILIKNMVALDKLIDEKQEGEFSKLINIETIEQQNVFLEFSKHFSSLFKK